MTGKLRIPFVSIYVTPDQSSFLSFTFSIYKMGMKSMSHNMTVRSEVMQTKYLLSTWWVFIEWMCSPLGDVGLEYQ